MDRSLVIAVFTLIICNRCSPPSNHTVNSVDLSSTTLVGVTPEKFQTTIDSLFNKLEACSANDSECLTSTNTSIEAVLNSIKDPSILESSNHLPPNTNGYFRANSTDGKLTVFSWDSRLGGSSFDYQALAVYKVDTEIRSKKLEFDKGPFYFNKIYQLKNDMGETVYILNGGGSSSQVDEYGALTAFTLRHGEITPAPIFPGNMSTLVQYNSTDTPVSFLVENNAQHILIPYRQNDSITVYHSIRFDKQQYKNVPTASDMKYGKFKQQDFLSESGLFKGTETCQKKNEGNVATYLFDDKISVGFENGEDETILSIQKNSQSVASIKLGRALFFMGKKGSHLFFEGDGTPESTTLFIYNLVEKKFIFIESIAQALVDEENLLFTQLSDEHTDTDFKTDCGNDEKQFEIKVTNFTQSPLVIETTGTGFCMYVQ